MSNRADDPDIRAARIASKLLDGDPITVIECPYWEDGKHCYAVSSPPLGRYDPRSLPKLCYCGAEVRPRGRG